MKHLLFLTFCFAALANLDSAAAANERPAQPLPNIVVIFSDDQGFHDVGCYGSEIKTPHLDQLARQGMRLTQFYAASSICTPSRYGLLTGNYAHRSQDQLLGALMFLEEEDAARGIRSGEATYVSMLNAAGYDTALVGKWHLGHGQQEFWPTEHGFDTFFGHTGGCVDFFTLNYANKPDWYRGRTIVHPDGYATDVITDEAIDVLRQSKRNDKPVYLHIAYNAPHFGKGWDDQAKKPVNVMQPSEKDLARVSMIEDPLRRAFAAKVVGMDQGIGRIMSALDELAMADNTLVIFMTDHGGDARYGGSNEPFRGGKATLFEGGIRVPCIIRWPETVPAGSVSDAVTCAIDLAETLAEITGQPMPDTDGQSILSVFKGEASDAPRTLVWKTGAHASLARKSWLAVRQGDWKWVRQPGKQGMLFDLESDPAESNDLAELESAIAKKLERIAVESR